MSAYTDAYRAFAVRVATHLAPPEAEDMADRLAVGDLDNLAEGVEGEYGMGRAAGDAARFVRCREDIARALGMDARRAPEWERLVVAVALLKCGGPS